MRCAPEGTLTPPVSEPATCARCGATLRRVPNGDEWCWVDAHGSEYGYTGPAEALEDPGGWWARLKRDDIAAYSVLSCAQDLGMLGWWHFHHAAGEPTASPVPWCCGMPMWYRPSGWWCRVSGQGPWTAARRVHARPTLATDAWRELAGAARGTVVLSRRNKPTGQRHVSRPCSPAALAGCVLCQTARFVGRWEALVKLNHDQRRTLEELERIVSSPERQVSRYGYGAALALRRHRKRGDLDRATTSSASRPCSKGRRHERSASYSERAAG
jgi:hypothetical protein